MKAQRIVCRANAPAKIREVGAKELEQAVQQRAKTLIIDFYATWCGPCVLQAKELVKVAEAVGDDVEILKIDTDRHPDISNQLQIMGLPTVIVVPADADKPATRTEGLLAADKIIEIVKNAAATPSAGQQQTGSNGTLHN